MAHRHRLIGLAAAMMLGLAAVLGGATAEADSSTIEDVRDQLQALETEQAEITAQLAETQQRLENVQTQLEQTRAEIDQRRAAMEDLQAQVTQLALVQFQTQGLDQAVILLGSDDVTTMLAELTTTQWLATTANGMLQQYQLERAMLADLEASQEEMVAEIEADEAAVQTLLDEVNARVTDTMTLLNRLTAAEQAQLARERAEALGDIDWDSLVTSGSLNRPVANRISSPYGYRYSPIYGTSEFHNGTDYDVSCGTPVAAAANGVVMLAEYRTGYGNSVIIDHGIIDGHHVITTYNHLQGFAVSVGTVVAQGQIIAYVGATGLATGCHLHFCVSIDQAYDYWVGGNVNPESIFNG